MKRLSPKLKRRSTRHVSEVTTIASEFGNSAKIIVPRSWLRKRVIAFLHSEFISKHPEQVIKRDLIPAYRGVQQQGI
jgi:putative transposon-encoded protein